MRERENKMVGYGIEGFNIKIRESLKKYKGKMHPVDKVGYKLKAYILAEKLKIAHAKVIGIYKRIEDVDWENLPDEFVIKPQQGSSLNGVLPLIYKDNKYKNLIGLYGKYAENIFMTREEAIAYFKKGIGSHSKSLWIEELLSNPCPCNWEFHSFNGIIGLVEQLAKASYPERRKFWTIDWAGLGHLFEEPEEGIKIKIDTTMQLPENKERLLEVARILSEEVNYPYVRVDLYSINGVIYIGELTPHPGTFAFYHLIDYWDKYLGELWKRAEGELSNG